MKLLQKILPTLFAGACAVVIVGHPLGMATANASTPALGGGDWNAENSNPNSWGWMQGFPPRPDRMIQFGNNSYAEFPQWRWSVCNFQQLMPSKLVSRGLTPLLPARKQLSNLDAVTFTPLGGGQPMTWKQAFDANFTDGIVVMHHGKIVYERYAGCLTPTNRHGAMSVTKSFVGLLGEMLVAEKRLDENQLVKHYIPELAQSAFGDATIRQVLDMTTGLAFSEDYANPNAEIWQHAAAGSPLPKPADYKGPVGYWAYLETVKKQGEHGRSFGYKTVNTDTLSWLISRASGKSVPDLLSEKIWQKLGTDLDAFMTVDSVGTPFAGGGLNLGLQDMARFGQMLLNNGKLGSQQVVPESVVRKIREGGDRRAFADAGYKLLPGWSYRSMWWITHNQHGAFMARGVYGQAIYIDPKADMVIARFASGPTASNSAYDPTSLPAYQAVAEYLMKRDRR